MAHKELLISWLNDAHAMENSLIRVLENHAKDTKDQHPQMHAKIQEHIEVTRRHAEMVKGCVERLGGSTSAIKTGVANVTGTIQGMSTGAAEDELVKNALADYSSEHFEIASYRALIAGAREFGDDETVRICEQILHEEEDMARWLERHIDTVVRDIFYRKAAGHQAA
jgi:ferritin-like metal-binding protein YciE